MANTPIYFLGHGGPNLIYEEDHPAYKQLQMIGLEITSKVKPKAVVVFSAHWQATTDTIEVNTAETSDLIYDFYGFPGQYYKAKFPHRGSKGIAQMVIGSLQSSGIKAKGVTRGLDHGVWVCFKCAFDPETNPLNAPIVQVSLPSTEEPQQYLQLGHAVSVLRSQNILVVVTGMAVHNLRDLRYKMVMPYTASFDEALKDAVEQDPAEREQSMIALLQRQDARRAHPTFEHLLPIYVGAGAANTDRGKRLWTLKEGSVSWAQYRFGELRAN